MKTVLVTGGTTRLGAAIVERLRADGWRVVTSSNRADAGADLVADLSDPAGPARLYADCLGLLDGNPPEALVNNAALFRGPDETLRRLAFEAPKKLTMMMAGRETGRGAVVNILDTRVLGAADGESDDAYARAKRDLLAFTRSAAALYAETLTVNGVAPGPVLAPTQVHEAAGELLTERPTPADVAAAVAFLLAVPSVTGAVVPVDGGQHLL